MAPPRHEPKPGPTSLSVFELRVLALLEETSDMPATVFAEPHHGVERGRSIDRVHSLEELEPD